MPTASPEPHAGGDEWVVVAILGAIALALVVVAIVDGRRPLPPRHFVHRLARPPCPRPARPAREAAPAPVQMLPADYRPVSTDRIATESCSDSIDETVDEAIDRWWR